MLIGASDISVAASFTITGVSDLRFGKKDELLVAFNTKQTDDTLVLMYYELKDDEHKFVVLSNANVDFQYSRSIKLGITSDNKSVNLFYRVASGGACDLVYKWFRFDNDIISNSEISTISLCSDSEFKFLAQIAQ